jgi:hypothetical protein
LTRTKNHVKFKVKISLELSPPNPDNIGAGQAAGIPYQVGIDGTAGNGGVSQIGKEKEMEFSFN